MDYKQHISKDLAMLLEDMGHLCRIDFFWDKVFVNEDRPDTIPRGDFAQLAQWSMLTTATVYFARLCSDDVAFTARGTSRANLTLERVATPLLSNLRWGEWISRELQEVIAFSRSPAFTTLRNRVLAHNDHATRSGADPFPNFAMQTLRRAIGSAMLCTRYCIAAELDNASMQPSHGDDVWDPLLECAHLRGQAQRVREALIGIEKD